MAINQAYRELIFQLKGLLPEYLKSQGIDTSGSHFQCINPDHKDNNPSCALIPPDNTALKCFSCSLSADLFLAAHLLEGLPTNGPEFITENVYILADRFGIPYETASISDEDRQSVECLRVYSLITDILNNSEDDTVAKEIYNWNLEEVRTVVGGIGTIKWSTLVKKLKAIGGYTEISLESRFGINPQLFGSNLLTIAIQNKSGATIGFAARDKRYKKNGRVIKWTNTSSDVSIYKKKNILFGIEHKLDKTGPLFLVEGYSDVIRLRLQGINSVLGYCSASISEAQANIISRTGKTDIIIVPDRETNHAGEKGIVRALDKVFKDFPDLRIKIKELPLPDNKDKIDPGEYLHTHSLKEFLALEDKEAFHWRLDRFPADMPTDAVYDKAMPLICEERNPVRQKRMLHQLSERIDIDVISLQRSLDQTLSEKRKQNKKRAQRVIRATRTELESVDTRRAPILLRKAAEQLEDLQSDKYTASDHGPEEYAAFIQELKKEYDNSGNELPGWTTGFPSFDDAFEGIPRKDCMMTIAAPTNTGKSITAQALGLQVALRNKNTAVLMYTIDDSRSQTTPRLLSQITSIPIAAIKQPNNPKYGLTEEHRKYIDTAWGDLKSMISHGRLDMKDASQGTSMEFAKRWIEDTRRRHPDWDILFVLDGFHKLTGLAGTDGREKIEYASNMISRLTKQEAISAVLTAELRKTANPSAAPNIEDVKGSNQIGYDSTVVLLLHNTMHSAAKGSKRDAIESWVDPIDNIEKPVIQIHVDKNKETSYKGMFRMRIRPECSQLLEMFPEENDWKDTTEPIEF